MSLQVNDKSNTIHELSNRLTDFFAEKSYGDGVREIYIGVTCVSPEFDRFFKPRKPCYDKNRRAYEKEGKPYELDHTVQLDVTLDFKTFQKMSFRKVEHFVGDSILEGVLQLHKLQISDFDVDTFIQDLHNYLRPASATA